MGLCDQLEATQAQRERRRGRLAAASLNRLNRPNDDAKAFRAQSRFHLCHLPRFTVRPDQIPALRQTIVNLAVRGRLVRQDPSDEPASERLKQIQVDELMTVCDRLESQLATAQTESRRLLEAVIHEALATVVKGN